MMPVELARRVGQHKARFSPYTTYAAVGIIIEVRCELCDVPIMGLKTDAAKSKAVLGAFSTYGEIMIDFDDGSKHHTSLCKRCIDGLTPEQLEEVYCGDLLQFEENEKLGDVPVNFIPMVERKPTGFRRVD